MRKKLLYPFLLLGGYAFLYFILRDKFLFTPDTSGTDILHFNIAYKYHLWKSIRHGEIPFWTDMLNGGFPLVAESQLGIFFLPYYLIFPLFSTFSHAYAFLFSFNLFILSVGMYYLLRTFKTPHFLSFLLSIIFTWNGSITFRWVHFTVLQAFSFTPFLFYFYLKWNETQKVRFAVVISFLISQMLCAGFVQSVFIALLGLVALYVLQNVPLSRKKTFVFISFIFFGTLLALPQILPTLQLSHYTSRNISNTYDFAVSVPFHINNVCSFISANCMGSAQNATYPSNWQVNGIYWENTPYIGLPFFLLVVFASILYFLKGKKNAIVSIFMSLCILFVLLALGKNSPLYFLFSIFPFSLFRTPPRYLLMAVFFLILYAASIVKEVIKKNILISLGTYFVLILNAIILIYTAFSYHLFIDASVIYKSLTQRNVVSNDSFYSTYGAQQEWNKIYSTWGWSTKKSITDYLFIISALLPNTNLITGHKSFEIYASLDMRRDLLIKSMITEGLDLATHSTIESSQSARVENLLQLYGITSLLSFKSLYLPGFQLVKTIHEGNLTINTYRTVRNSNNIDYYLPQTIQRATSVEGIMQHILKGIMTESNSFAESIHTTITQHNIKITMHIDKKRDNDVIYNVFVNKTAFVVFRKKWYPGWKLYIDGQEHPLYRTNLIHIGTFIPQGRHTIELTYIPVAFYIGSFISLSVVAIGCIVFILKVRKRSE